MIVNEDGIYDLTADTTITLDGKPLERRFLDLEARGYRARYIVEGNLQSGLNRGVLKSIELETRLRGPVTSTDPLKVLEQSVVVTDDTVLVDVPGDDLANVQTGDILEVSGLAREDGSTEATMLRLRTDTDETMNGKSKDSRLTRPNSVSSLETSRCRLIPKPCLRTAVRRFRKVSTFRWKPCPFLDI